MRWPETTVLSEGGPKHAPHALASPDHAPMPPRTRPPQETPRFSRFSCSQSSRPVPRREAPKQASGGLCTGRTRRPNQENQAFTSFGSPLSDDLRGPMAQHGTAMTSSLTHKDALAARPHVVIVGAGFGGLAGGPPPRSRKTPRHRDRPAQPPPVPAAPLPGGDRGAQSQRHRRRRSAGSSGDQQNADGPAGRRRRAFDLERKMRAILADGEVPYDYLIVATGSDALVLRPRRVGGRMPRGSSRSRMPWKSAARCSSRSRRPSASTDAKRAAQWMTFVVVGGGPTGVELAGALARDRADDAGAGLPAHRPAQCARRARRGRAAGARRPIAEELSESAQEAARGPGRRGADRRAGDGHRRGRGLDRRRADRRADRALGGRRGGLAAGAGRSACRSTGRAASWSSRT